MASMLLRWSLRMLLLTALAASCCACDAKGGISGAAAAGGSDATAGTRQDVLLVAAHEGSWRVRDADGAARVEIEMTRRESVIRFAEMTLRGEIRAGQRRYRFAGERDHHVGVSRRGPLLRLSDRSGKLLWEVELGPQRVVIRDVEPGGRSYQVVAAADGGSRASADGVSLGAVRWEASTKRVSVHDVAGDELYSARPAAGSLLWGMLLMTDIPEAHRYIMMAEIGARGR